MASGRNLLEEFFRFECTLWLKGKLQAALNSSEPPPYMDFGGNVWTVEIYFEEKVVLIQDDLTVGKDGEQRVPIEEFSRTLEQWQPTKDGSG